MRILSIVCVLLALAGCQKSEPAPQANETAASADAGEIKGVHRDNKGKTAPAVEFNDPDGKTTSLAAFAGKPTLVNLWATWCAPCVKELPTLDRLSKADSGNLNVVAVSQDFGPRASVVAFLQSNKIVNLDPYQDPKMALSTALGAPVLPTSVLFDANGKEVWRYVGDLDWTSAEAAKLLAEGGVSPPR
ncbi:MAG TPA: TlpA disulfide reductase family protein [Sphingomicrobium sp.]|nr:TlpA disulfide reductase family protein [Sphingomicrobium sp.]